MPATCHFLPAVPSPRREGLIGLRQNSLVRSERSPGPALTRAAPLAGGIELAEMLILAFDIEFDVLALGFQIHFRSRQFTSGQSDVCRTLRIHERNANLKTDVEIVPLEPLKEILKVVELGKQAIFGKEVDGRPFGSYFALQPVFARLSLKFGLLQIEAARESALDNILLPLLLVERDDLRFNLDAPIWGNTDQRRELTLENPLPALELHNPLFGACLVELGPSHFNRQFATFARSLTRKDRKS